MIFIDTLIVITFSYRLKELSKQADVISQYFENQRFSWNFIIEI